MSTPAATAPARPVPDPTDALSLMAITVGGAIIAALSSALKIIAGG